MNTPNPEPLNRELETITTVWHHLTTGAWTYNNATGDIISRRTGRPLIPRKRHGRPTVTVHIRNRSIDVDTALITRLTEGITLSRHPNSTRRRK